MCVCVCVCASVIMCVEIWADRWCVILYIMTRPIEMTVLYERNESSKTS